MSAMAPVGARNRKLTLALAALALGMVGFSFALSPLYGLYCKVVGANKIVNAPAAASANATVKEDRWVTVEFDANVSDGLPWDFAPVQRSLRVRVGEKTRALFRARNRSTGAVVGQAIPAITPWQVTGFLNKLECFCFNRQELAAGETQDMPLYFVVSPDLPREYESLVLSYTFMNATGKAAQKQPGSDGIADISKL